LTQIEGEIHFNYGKSYLERTEAIAIYAPELPLQAGARSEAAQGASFQASLETENLVHDRRQKCIP
jgi:hypothetical protein